METGCGLVQGLEPGKEAAGDSALQAMRPGPGTQGLEAWMETGGCRAWRPGDWKLQLLRAAGLEAWSWRPQGGSEARVWKPGDCRLQGGCRRLQGLEASSAHQRAHGRAR